MKTKDILKKTKYVTKIGSKWMPDINTDFHQKLGEQMADMVDRSVYDTLIFGSLYPYGSRYRNKRVKRYLYIPYPSFEWQEQNDFDDGWVKEGLLISLSWWKTPIVIGTEVIKVPVYRKPKAGGTIKFVRYGNLEPVKIKYGKRKANRTKEKRQTGISTPR